MPLKIFFCYAREDEELLNQLKNHLMPLQRQGLIEMWYDRNVNPGEEWERQIDENMSMAEIILLLISPQFISSDYCYNREMSRALERHEREAAHVIPIILRPVLWKETPIGKLQVLPSNGEPVISSSGPIPDEAWLDVANGISKIVKEKKGLSPSTTTTLSVQGYLSIVQSYVDHMSELIRKDNPRESKSDDVVRSIARMQTLTTLRRLDAVHKEHVLRFLSEAGLISVINLYEADLSEVHLSELDLCNANMRRVNLSNSSLFAINMNGANLAGANLSGAYLGEINLSDADLVVADLSYARLFTVNLNNANLNHARLTGASLSGVGMYGANLFAVDLSTVTLDTSRMNTVELYIAQFHGANLGGITITDEELQAITNGVNVIKDTFGSIREAVVSEQLEPRMFTQQWYNQEIAKAFDNLPD